MPVDDRLLPRLSAVLLLIFAALAVTFPLTNTDIWWHLASGREILERGAFLRVDPFSLGALGQRWIDVHWLFQVLALGVYRAAGIGGLVLAKGVICAGAALVLVLAAEQQGGDRRLRPLAVLSVALLLYLGRYLVLARPIVLTLLLISCFLLVLERVRAGRSGPLALLWLLPLQVAWANIQGLYLLGPVLVACYAAGEGAAALLSRWGAAGFSRGMSLRSLAWLGLCVPALLAACLVTPYGLEGLELPLKLFGRIEPLRGELFRYNVSENIPLWTLERSGGAAAAGVAHVKWVAAAAFASFLPLLRRGVVLARFVALAAMFALALIANRNMLLFYWVAALVLPLNLGALAATAARRRWAPALGGLSAAGIVGLALLTTSASSAEGPITRPAPFRLPEGAVTRLEQLDLRGNVFNSVRYGSYLIWRLYPRRRPFIDGRLVIRSTAQFAEHLELADAPTRTFEAFRRRHAIRLALLPTAYPDRYLPLVAHLYRSPDWSLVYTDGTETLFYHRGVDDGVAALDLSRRPAVERIEATINRRQGQQPMIRERALVHLGRLLVEVGEPGQATQVLASLSSHAARALLARAHYQRGRAGRARALCLRLVQEQPRDVGSLVLLARLAAEEGKHARAVAWLRRGLEVEPRNASARRLLEQISRAAGMERGLDPYIPKPGS
jgi:tetratricopeptide (TPR) repeat protein